MIKQLITSAVIFFIFATTCFGQDIDPRGMYFNRFTGSFDGTEWFQLVNTSGDTYLLRDIYGGGFTGTINEDGDITIGAFPPGSFSSPDEFVIFPVLGGSSFTFDCNRVPTTTPDFPLRLFSPRSANELLDGQWNNTLQFINPETGAPGPPASEIITISTNGNTVRITDPGGLFFQGVFEDGLTAGFRVVNNPFFGGAASGIYATFPGSSTNIGQDLNGEMNMININEFRASFLLQTRQQLGNQTQSLVEFHASRINPIECGDANGDGVINALDNAIVDFLQGVTFESNSYNLAADFNGDGIIDTLDLSKTCLSGDVNLDGEINLLDVSVFVLFVTQSIYFCEADANQDGVVDLLDVSPFIELLTGG